jgi:hypothetical protein
MLFGEEVVLAIVVVCKLNRTPTVANVVFVEKIVPGPQSRLLFEVVLLTAIAVVGMLT